MGASVALAFDLIAYDWLRQNRVLSIYPTFKKLNKVGSAVIRLHLPPNQVR